MPQLRTSGCTFGFKTNNLNSHRTVLQMAQVVKRTLNAEIPYVPWLTGYLAIAVGAIVTFLVQSSSVFTSTLVNYYLGPKE